MSTPRSPWRTGPSGHASRPRSWPSGDEVGVTFAPNDLLFFDPENGERISLPADARPTGAEPREAVAR